MNAIGGKQPQTDSNIALSFEDIVKTYGDFTAVNSLSFSVPKGSIFGLLGANGAGKTTSIRMILGIVQPTSGTISVLGKNSIQDFRDNVGYLPEERGLYKKRKVLETVIYFAKLKGMDSERAKQQAELLLEKYGLSEFNGFKIGALSKGMSQKVQLISTVVHQPDLVILDEPFSGLDPVNQQVLEELILDLAANGQTIIFSTHVMQHAERLCDHLLLMARGKKIFDGSVGEAKNTLPKTIIIETKDDIASLHNHTAIKAIEPLQRERSERLRKESGFSDAASRRWKIFLQDRGDPQQILQHCFTSGIALSSFEQRNPSLHDVFVELVGGEKSEKTIAAVPEEVVA